MNETTRCRVVNTAVTLFFFMLMAGVVAVIIGFFIAGGERTVVLAVTPVGGNLQNIATNQVTPPQTATQGTGPASAPGTLQTGKSAANIGSAAPLLYVHKDVISYIDKMYDRYSQYTNLILTLFVLLLGAGLFKQQWDRREIENTIKEAFENEKKQIDLKLKQLDDFKEQLLAIEKKQHTVAADISSKFEEQLLAIESKQHAVALQTSSKLEGQLLAIDIRIEKNQSDILQSREEYNLLKDHMISNLEAAGKISGQVGRDLDYLEYCRDIMRALDSDSTADISRGLSKINNSEKTARFFSETGLADLAVSRLAPLKEHENFDIKRKAYMAHLVLKNDEPETLAEMVKGLVDLKNEVPGKKEKESIEKALLMFKKKYPEIELPKEEKTKE
ncbi:MAG: hypothetical protein GY765_29700 [bacterium]|nr:hypothetical protein [bacterium]